MAVVGTTHSFYKNGHATYETIAHTRTHAHTHTHRCRQAKYNPGIARPVVAEMGVPTTTALWGSRSM